MVVHIEDKGGLPREVQGVQGTCRDAIGAQDQGVSGGQWWGVHIQGLLTLLEDTRHREATINTIHARAGCWCDVKRGNLD